MWGSLHSKTWFVSGGIAGAVAAVPAMLEFGTPGRIAEVVAVEEKPVEATFPLLAPMARKPAHVERGKGSYYGPEFEGKRTANGEVFRANTHTAAHRSLPFGTKVRVKNLANGREVTLRINNRGPFVKGRIIDVSERAARDLGMIKKGVVPVEVTVLEEPPQIAKSGGSKRS